MNILMMASSSGFLSYHLTRLSISLRKRGQHVIVLSGPSEQMNGLSTELAEAGIEHVTSNHVDKRGFYDVYGCKKEIEGIIESRDLDIIHAHGVIHTLGAYFAIRSSHSKKRPSIVTNVHYVPEAGFLIKPKWTLMRTILNACSDMILPVSNTTRALLIEQGLNPQKTITVHNAIDLDVFDADTRRTQMDFERDRSSEQAIVYVANLIPRKGQEYYLMAAAEVLKNHPAKFYVIGGGPRRKYLEKLTYRLGIEEDVVFTGRIPYHDMYYFLSAKADVCVSASLWELFPFYILECMATGKPVVATDVGGVSEAVIDGVNGYIVPPRDPTSLAEAILRLIKNPDIAREMGAKGRRIVEQEFSMEIIARKLCDVYELASKRKMSA